EYFKRNFSILSKSDVIFLASNASLWSFIIYSLERKLSRRLRLSLPDGCGPVTARIRHSRLSFWEKGKPCSCIGRRRGLTKTMDCPKMPRHLSMLRSRQILKQLADP